MSLVRRACPICHGSRNLHCEFCAGRGYRESARSGPGQETCTMCHGSGRRMCYPCGGEGYNLVPADSPDLGIEETDSAPEADLDAETPPPDYTALYHEALEEAQRDRRDLLDWLWSSEGFRSDFKSQLNDWLSALDLSAEGTKENVQAKADLWDLPDKATKTGTLILKMRGLVRSCGKVDLYRTAKG